MESQAWVTLATNDPYALGGLVLARSLKRSGTTRKIVILVTSGISDQMMSLLRENFDEVVFVDELDSQDAANLGLLERPELGVTFTKLHCWKLTGYSKCVFLDADTMVVQNSDELFDREELSASPDAGWPDCFNSGVFVFRPSLETYGKIIEHARSEGSFDGGDQGLLNTFFSDWATKDISRHLPFIYNMVATSSYTYLPAYKRFGKDVKIVHFIGYSKPWHAVFDSAGQPVPRQEADRHALEHLKHWWTIYQSDVKPSMKFEVRMNPFEPTPRGETGPMGPSSSQGAGGGPRESLTPDDFMARFQDKIERQQWEEGHPDYMGSSSMDNILKKIDSTLSSPVSGQPK